MSRSDLPVSDSGRRFGPAYRGTTALVTGASSGIGQEFAHQLAARGADLVLVARREDRLTALAQSLRDKHGVTAQPLPFDLGEPGAAAALASSLAGRSLHPDTLVNAAGVGTHGAFAAADPAAISAELRLNVTATVELSRAFLPGMLASGRGALVNIASTAAYQPTPSMAVYGAGKAFVLHFTEALAYETRHSGLRVLAISPGPTSTEFFDVLGTRRPAVGRWQTPHEVVSNALRALDRRHTPPSLISGRLNAVPVLGARFSPRRLTLAISGLALGAGRTQYGGRSR
jgi:uncharacterized protein